MMCMARWERQGWAVQDRAWSNVEKVCCMEVEEVEKNKSKRGCVKGYCVGESSRTNGRRGRRKSSIIPNLIKLFNNTVQIIDRGSLAVI